MSKPVFKALLAPALAAALAAFAPSGASAASADYGSYTVTYDASTFLGGIAGNSTGGGGSVGFNWNFPTTSVSSTSGLDSVAYTLPEFTIAPKAGYALSGAVSGALGNLSYTEFMDGATTLTFAATVSVDGGAATPFSILLGKTPANAFTGIYSGTGSVAAGTFSSFHFYAATLTASANVTGTGLASITSQPQNQFSIGFIATAVPELESYLMFLAGLGLIGAITRRRVGRAA